jgi:hypothetical protein
MPDGGYLKFADIASTTWMLNNIRDKFLKPEIYVWLSGWSPYK